MSLCISLNVFLSFHRCLYASPLMSLCVSTCMSTSPSRCISSFSASLTLNPLLCICSSLSLSFPLPSDFLSISFVPFSLPLSFSSFGCLLSPWQIHIFIHPSLPLNPSSMRPSISSIKSFLHPSLHLSSYPFILVLLLLHNCWTTSISESSSLLCISTGN